MENHLFSRKKKEINDKLPVQDGELTHVFNLCPILSLIKMTVGFSFFSFFKKTYKDKEKGGNKILETETRELAQLSLPEKAEPEAGGGRGSQPAVWLPCLCELGTRWG